MKEEYDVAIVGAGPAGLATAKKCAELGLDTLLVEEHAAIGVPVQCGESLVVHAFDHLGMEKKGPWIANDKVNCVRIWSPNMEKLDVKLPIESNPLGLMIERKMFEKALGVMAAKAGADVQTKCPAVGILKEGNKVAGIEVEQFGERHKIRSKIVVGADGPLSKVAGWAGIDVYHDIGKFDTCAQYQMAGVDIQKETAELFFGKHAPKGAVWILPKQDGFANVGLGMTGRDPNTALEYLNRFVAQDERLKDGSIVEVNAGPVPVGSHVDRMVADGIMLVGDAARQVNAMTGGGMVFGIHAGVMAAQTAKQAVEANDFSESFLSKYQKTWTKEYGKKFARMLKLKKAIYEMSDKELDGFLGGIGEVVISQEDTRIDIGWLAFRSLAAVALRKPKLALKFGKIFALAK